MGTGDAGTPSVNPPAFRLRGGSSPVVRHRRATTSHVDAARLAAEAGGG
jgi:hypothetical protein